MNYSFAIYCMCMRAGQDLMLALDTFRVCICTPECKRLSHKKTVSSSGFMYCFYKTTNSHFLSLTCQFTPHAYSPQATNRRTLGAMVKEMSKGGKLVWIAPSGGRDRPDPESGDWLPHQYDPGQACSTAISPPCQAYAALRIIVH